VPRGTLSTNALAASASAATKNQQPKSIISAIRGAAANKRETLHASAGRRGWSAKWSREQLEKMDTRFRSRLERAIANGRERAPRLHLTDQQMTLLRQLAAPLAPSQRSAFLEEVARRLHGVELGDGVVARAACEAQAAIRKASPWLQV